MSPRRFSFVPPLFFVLWALWFVLPPTRDIARQQWKARLVPTPTPTSYASSVVTLPGDASRDADFIRALDARDAAYMREISNGNFKYRSNEPEHALEELGRRYPQDAAICATQLAAMINALRLYAIRQPGPSSSADLNWSVKLTPIQTPAPELLKSWFAATARGAKLEPDNTFWDWAQIIGLLATRRDNEVWRVLRIASLKPNYDDHANEVSLARVRLARGQKIESPIEQFSTASRTLSSFNAALREAARQISDNASGLRIRGGAVRQKQALEGMRDFALVARVMRREHKDFVGSLVGGAVESIAMYGGSYSPLSPKRGKRPARGASVASYGSDSRSLLYFARKQGRSDIAAQLSRQWIEMGVWRAKSRAVVADASLVGLSVRDFGIAQAGDWLGSLLLAGMPALLGVAVLSSSLLWLVPSWRRESHWQPSRLSWGGGALVSMVALLMLSSSALYRLWNVWRLPKSTTFSLLFEPISGDSGGAGIVPLVWQHQFPAVLGVLVALWLAALWEARRQGRPALVVRLRRLFHAPDDGMARFDATPLLALAGALAAFCLFFGGALGFLILSEVNDDFKALQNYSGPILVGLTVVLFLPFLLRLRTSASRAFALIMVRRLAWGQLLFLTVLWGVLWLAAMPAQRRFEADFTRQLQLGEFQLIRKQIGL